MLSTPLQLCACRLSEPYPHLGPGQQASQRELTVLLCFLLPLHTHSAQDIVET